MAAGCNDELQAVRLQPPNRGNGEWVELMVSVEQGAVEIGGNDLVHGVSSRQHRRRYFIVACAAFPGLARQIQTEPRGFLLRKLPRTVRRIAQRRAQPGLQMLRYVVAQRLAEATAQGHRQLSGRV